MPPKPVVLCILDGWGHAPAGACNAVTLAKAPTWRRWMAETPHALIDASELHVGLPEGQMGNSEVGHMNIGAGRVVMQELPRIDAAIALRPARPQPRASGIHRQAEGAPGGRCHLMGLLSPGGVHSHQDHMAALAKRHSRRRGRRCWSMPSWTVAIPRRKARATISPPSPPRRRALRIATVSGRYYAMDRDKRWDRVEKWPMRTLVEAAGERAASADDAVLAAYKPASTDEFVVPTVLGDYAGMEDGDGLLLANFRADRAREISDRAAGSRLCRFRRASAPAASPPRWA